MNNYSGPVSSEPEVETEVVERPLPVSASANRNHIHLGGDDALTFEVDVDSLPLAAAEEVARIVMSAPESIAHPKVLLDSARNPSSPLHSFFEWDDTRAAEKYRLDQARSLLTRVKVFQAFGEQKVKIRAFVSLSSDRIAGGGYRPIGAVMGNAERRDELLKTAKGELASFQKRYQNLTDILGGVMAEIDKLKEP